MKNFNLVAIFVVFLCVGCQPSNERQFEIAFSNGQPVAILTNGDAIVGDPEASYAFGTGKAICIYKPLGDGRVAKYLNTAKNIITYNLQKGFPISVSEKGVRTGNDAVQKINTRAEIGYTPLNKENEGKVSINPVGPEACQIVFLDEGISHAVKTYTDYFNKTISAQDEKTKQLINEAVRNGTGAVIYPNGNLLIGKKSYKNAIKYRD